MSATHKEFVWRNGETVNVSFYYYADRRGTLETPPEEATIEICEVLWKRINDTSVNITDILTEKDLGDIEEKLWELR